MRKVGRFTGALVLMLVVLLSSASVAVAQQATDVEIDSPVRGLHVDAGRDRVDLDVVFYNRTDERRLVSFEVLDVPEGWNIGFWNRLFDFRVQQVIVEPTAADPERLQQARLRIVPPEGVEPGTYNFRLRATSPDGSVVYDDITYTIEMGEEDAAAAGGATLGAEIPVLQGPPGTTLGFEIIVGNDTGEEASFNLSAQPPAGWQVTFREPFGEQRVIGGVSVGNALTERVRVDVRVPQGTALGEYTIPVSAVSNNGQASVDLDATIVGRGELRATTPTGNLNVTARAGGGSTSTIRLNNPGTDTLRDIVLSAGVPSGWSVEFGVPNNTVAELPANNQIDVDVTITPPAEAIAGDYIVTMRANAEQVNASSDWRVTVTQSTIWGWLGVVLVVLVVGGMIGLFLRLGRR